MISIRNILVPVDFSEASLKAARYGLTLASQLKAGLAFVHVAADPSAAETATSDLKKLIPPEIARDQNKDLWDRAMLGATAEWVVRLAHVPVFSVPAAAPDVKEAGLRGLISLTAGNSSQPNLCPL